MALLVVTEVSNPIPKASLPGITNSAHLSLIEPLPSYNEAIIDEPPSYAYGEESALAKPPYLLQENSSPYDYIPQHKTSNPMTVSGIDFDDTSSFRQVGGKKAKKAQQQAQQSKWADDGDEGNKDGGEGDPNEGEGGGSNNGGGGAGDGGGGGGDDWNDWDTGNKKKKGKKAKEEEKKKQEEEEEEKRKKEEEAANGNNALSWADDANGDLGDDWGSFAATKKDKKGKKGKVSHICLIPMIAA